MAATACWFSEGRNSWLVPISAFYQLWKFNFNFKSTSSRVLSAETGAEHCSYGLSVKIFENKEKLLEFFLKKAYLRFEVFPTSGY